MHFVNPWTHAWSGKCIRLLPRPMYKADCLFVHGLLSRVREHFFFSHCSFTSDTFFANKDEGSLLWLQVMASWAERLQFLAPCLQKKKGMKRILNDVAAPQQHGRSRPSQV